jgi:antitoxin component of RelBE/YafQ-DinJ toxin-antitoxin module
MNTISLHIKIEADIKRKAQKTASDLGLFLSAVTKALLKEFFRSKRLAVGGSERPEIPNARLRKSLQESEEDIKAGRTIKFKNINEAVAYLDTSIADDKRKTKGKN